MAHQSRKHPPAHGQTNRTNPKDGGRELSHNGQSWLKAERELQGTIRRLDKRLKQEMAVNWSVLGIARSG